MSTLLLSNEMMLLFTFNCVFEYSCTQRPEKGVISSGFVVTTVSHPMWLLGTKLGSSRGAAASVLKYWAISPATCQNDIYVCAMLLISSLIHVRHLLILREVILWTLGLE